LWAPARLFLVLAQRRRGWNLYNYLQLPVNASGMRVLAIHSVSRIARVCSTWLYVHGQRSRLPDRNQFIHLVLDADMISIRTSTLPSASVAVRGELYNILNHHNQYINILNLDVAGITEQSFIQTEKGARAESPAAQRTSAEHPFGLKLTF